MTKNQFKRGSFTRSIKLVILSLILLVSFSVESYATHFRYGNISWSRGQNDTIIFQISQSWRRSFYGAPTVGSVVATTIFQYGDGATTTLNITVTAVNTTEDWFNGIAMLKHKYATNGTYSAGYNDCCRISTLLNGNNDQSFINRVDVQVGNLNNSPISTVPSFVNFNVNTLNTFQIPGFDPDGHTISYSITSTALSGLPQTTPTAGTVLTLSSTGLINWTPNASGLYALNVTITDQLGASTVVDFLIRVGVFTSVPPTFDYAVTPANNFVYSVQPGTPINFSVKADDTDPLSQVTLLASGLPVGVTFTPSLPTNGNPVTTNFSFTPTNANIGNYAIVFTATDNNNLQAFTTVYISVNTNPVFDVPPTLPNNSEECLMTGTPYVTPIQASNALSAVNVSLVSMTGLPAGATMVPSLPTAPAMVASSDLTWTPVPSEWGFYTGVWTATDANSMSTNHTISFIINTSPVFTSAMPSSSATVGSLYAHTFTGTDANLPYGDDLELNAVGYPSWLTFTDNGNGNASLSGTPGAGDVGTYTFPVYLEDFYHHCGNAVFQMVTITVSNCNQVVNEVQTACGNYTWPANNMTYTASGTYTFVSSGGVSGMYASNGGANANATDGGAIMTTDMTNANSTVIGTPVPGDGITGIDFMTNGDMYGFVSTGDLIQINPATGAVITNVGPVTLNGNPIILTDMAIDPTTDEIYGTTGPSGPLSNQLVKVDASTAVATYIGQPVAAGSFLAITFDAQGTLYGLRTNSASDLLTIDKTNGSILSNTVLSITIGAVGLGMDKATNTIYASECCTTQGNQLYSILPNGTTTFIGLFGGNRRVQDLAVLNSSGCPTTYNLDLTINPLPSVSVTDIYSCPGVPIPLNGMPSGGFWNLSNPYFGSSTGFTYYYTDANGCTNAASGNIIVGQAQIVNVTVTNITGISASVNYQGVNGIGWYDLRWRPIGSSTWITGTNYNFTTKLLTNLIPNTAYEVQVRGYCSVTSPAGPWTTASFSTNNLCSVPTGLFANNISAATAKLNWNAVPGVAFYTIRWKPVSGSTWTSATSTVPSKVISGLTASTAYEFQVRSHCGSSAGAFSASSNFTTAATKGGAGVVYTEVGGMDLKVYPNPTNGEFNVEFTIDRDGEASIKLLDLSGRVVKQVQTVVSEGINLVTLNIAELTTGMYQIQVENEGSLKSVSKILKN